MFCYLSLCLFVSSSNLWKNRQKFFRDNFIWSELLLCSSILSEHMLSGLPLCAFRVCRKKLNLVEKAVEQTSHLKGFVLTDTCTLRCLRRLPLWENVFLHIPQEKGFSWKCARRCLERHHFWEKLLKHLSQEKAEIGSFLRLKTSLFGTLRMHAPLCLALQFLNFTLRFLVTRAPL